jgi:hypothetical protein
MSKSDFLENAILDHMLGGPDYVRPANVHVALFTAAPSDAGGGTEVTGGSYARAAVVNNATNWPAASGGSKSNGTQIIFPTPSAPWGTVTHFGIFDEASGGNLLRWGALTVQKTIGAGDPVYFPAGTLVASED